MVHQETCSAASVLLTTLSLYLAGTGQELHSPNNLPKEVEAAQQLLLGVC